MYKKIKSILIVSLLIITTMFIANAVASNSLKFDTSSNDQIKNNFDYIEEQMLSSSKYTQKSDYSNERIDDYLINYVINYDEAKYNELGYVKALSNENYTLYFENDSYSVVVVNNKTGFIWSSRAEFQKMTDGNNTFRNQMNSGIWIEYIRTNVNPFVITTHSLYQAAKVSYKPETEVSEELRPYSIKEGSYDKKLVEVTSTFNENENKIVSLINYKDVKISFEVELTLNDKGINVYVNNDTVKEGNELIRLTGVFVLPYLGSAREDKVPGYSVIPDGIGALVRFNSGNGSDFNARVFGNDKGSSGGYLPNITLPIFGMVHHEDNNAMYGHITHGAENVILQGRNWGKTSRFYRLNTKYLIRQVFKTIIDRGGNGYDDVIEEISPGYLSLDYYFLSGDSASYIGIASHYQNILVSNNDLNKVEATSGNIPLSTNYLMADKEKTFLGYKSIIMSNTKQIETMYDYFIDNKINNQVVTLSGYSTGGSAMSTPHELKYVESNKKMNNLVEHIRKDDNDVYLENSYTFASSVSSRLSYNKDVGRNLSELRMKDRNIDINGNEYDTYSLYPERSLAYIKNDIKRLDKLNASGFTLLNDSHTIYSTTKGSTVNNRTINLEYSKELLELANGSLLSVPNEYALKYASGYVDLVISNSQFDYYTDLVPLIPMVLKGYLDYYSTYLNFNALGNEKILTMIDFAINPSYILTYEDTFKMRRTMSSYLYSTSFEDYKEDVVETYNYINEALKYVRGATMKSREILVTGVVKVSYSNNVSIYINYTSNSYNDGSVSINANDYKVVS